MDFSISNVGSENFYLFDSEIESCIQLVFVPGVFSGEAWRYQLNFFSEDYRTVSFFPSVSNRGFEGQKKCLKQLIEKDEMDNVVLIGANYGNCLVQSFEGHESVLASVMVGAKKSLKKSLPLPVYNLLVSEIFPCKLVKKFLMPSLSFEQVKDFCGNVDFVNSDCFEGFQRRFGVRKPEKSCLIVHGDKDYFSDRDFAQSLMTSASVSELNAGVFGFYEKPQMFNKILHDFLLKIERKSIKESIELEKDENRNLSEFTGSKGKRLAQVE